jgi:hypothetical protein
VTAHAPRRTTPVELTDDTRFLGRIRRLGLVSLIAPGLIWWLATRLAVPQPLLFTLLAGWWSMPAVLFASIPFPSVRPLLIVPATLITAPVLAIVAGWLPGRPVADFGWILIAVGLLLGGVLGGWFWFRWAPVPAALDYPFAPARWGLIAIHVGLICVGLVLAVLG